MLNTSITSINSMYEVHVHTFEVRLAALILKNVNLLSVATAFANSVLPVPGGPYSSTPRAGALNPVNRSGLQF
jgi:hypothetical protein